MANFTGGEPDALAGPPLFGAIQLPDGSWIRGRGIQQAEPDGPRPSFGLYLGVRYAPEWQHQRVDWPDFWLPRDARTTARTLQEVHNLARSGAAVEIACAGGRGRTGTAIACLAILAGVRPEKAVSWTRQNYRAGAVEMPWQRSWVRNFPSLLGKSPG